jgi:hypothetical protein
MISQEDVVISTPVLSSTSSMTLFSISLPFLAAPAAIIRQSRQGRDGLCFHYNYNLLLTSLSIGRPGAISCKSKIFAQICARQKFIPPGVALRTHGCGGFQTCNHAALGTPNGRRACKKGYFPICAEQVRPGKRPCNALSCS